ncbi:FAD-binding protein [Thermodesulfobacteriota bacterium]
MEKHKNDVWVYIDCRNKRHFDASLNVLGAAVELAKSISGKSIALVIDTEKDEKSGSSLPVESVVQTCMSNGADEVYTIENPHLSSCRADIHAQAISSLVRERSPKIVLFTLSDFGRETASICAVMNDSGLIADCVEFSVEEGKIIAGCPSWGGEIMARLTYTFPGDTGFATVQANAFSPSDQKGNPGRIEKISVEGVQVPGELNSISLGVEKSEHRKLEDADTVVVGGAGVGSLEGFTMVRNLSAAVGGEVGATRPPVLKHWVDEERLIGQTGKTVRPELLISIGASGAVQYTAGIVESGYIVAINRDPDSPIFNVADTGIVADAKAIMPLITSRIKQTVMRDIADTLSIDKNDGGTNGFGEKIRKLRESNNWTVEYLAQQTDQSPDFIEQVEKNEVTPSVSFLLKLSRALDVDPGTFLKEEEKAYIEDQRAQAFIKRTKNYAYQTLTPGAENQHLRGFMITIEPRQAHKPVAYKHEGEEFVFVMEGSLELTLDNKVNYLKTGESMHYNSEIPHKLKNLGNETTRCLVMLYTP